MTKYLLPIIGASLLAFAGCSKTSDADRAAKVLTQQRGELATELDETAKGVAKEATDVAWADRTFKLERTARIANLQAIHAVDATLTTTIATALSFQPVTDAGRIVVNEKLVLLDLRVGEAAKAIEALQAVDAAAWATKSKEAATLMERVDDAIKGASGALRDAPRVASAS
ncbi:MAG: hypothetical protein NT062_09570 [Proteobacteria bacterium]|nr:hypothetical protein [Pseudomonadota bacterium]